MLAGVVGIAQVEFQECVCHVPYSRIKNDPGGVAKPVYLSGRCPPGSPRLYQNSYAKRVSFDTFREQMLGTFS
jgi:hypothetical protein